MHVLHDGADAARVGDVPGAQLGSSRPRHVPPLRRLLHLLLLPPRIPPVAPRERPAGKSVANPREARPRQRQRTPRRLPQPAQAENDAPTHPQRRRTTEEVAERVRSVPNAEHAAENAPDHPQLVRERNGLRRVELLRPRPREQPIFELLAKLGRGNPELHIVLVDYGPVGAAVADVFVHDGQRGVLHRNGDVADGYVTERARRCMMLTVFVLDAVATTLAFFLMAKSAISASFLIIYPFAGELYPTQLRGIGIGISAYLGGVGLIIIPFITYLVGEKV